MKNVECNAQFFIFLFCSFGPYLRQNQSRKGALGEVAAEQAPTIQQETVL